MPGEVASYQTTGHAFLRDEQELGKVSTKPSPQIAIVAPLNGWILDKLAAQLVDGIEACVRWRSGSFDACDLVYFVPYYYWKPLPTRTAAFFTHIPEEPDRQELFFRAAEQCDYGVAMSAKYYDAIVAFRRERGKSTEGYVRITPNPDKCFTPKLRLANVGRMYPRKGPELLKAVAELPFVELICTEGNLSEAEVVRLYQSVDYTLITAVIEGGPMCLLESLACGAPVIAPHDVGLVPEFKEAGEGGNVYKYQTGDWQSLKELLYRLYEKKLAVAAEVNQAAPGWVEGHRRFFELVLGGEVE